MVRIGILWPEIGILRRAGCAPAWPVDDPALQTAVARSPGVGAMRGARFDAKKKFEKKNRKRNLNRSIG